MDNVGRSRFWNVLSNLHEVTEESISVLMEASPLPKFLCRFRVVNERSLQRLNDNKLFFSSASSYDDPFDTYFHIDTKQMISLYKAMREELAAESIELIDQLHRIASFVGQNPDTFVHILSNESLNFFELQGQLEEVRSSIQRGLFSICFCENPYNETLWLKYADNYTGFVQVYNMEDQKTFLCGKEEECKNCISAKERPYIYPVYYSDVKYNATYYALGIKIMQIIERRNDPALIPLYDFVQSSLVWEAERISLIKKKCHEYDQEWRMIRPGIIEQRTNIKMKPCKVIIGLRTPDYESRLITSAALNAGINEIHKLYINDSDELASKPISVDL